MNTYISDEKREISYILQGDYYLPDFRLPEKGDHSIGIWGQRHLRYLKRHRKVLYYNLLTIGRLNSYLANIDTQAENLFSQLVMLMCKQEGVNEQLKTDSPKKWIAKRNSICNRAAAIVNKEFIYVEGNADFAVHTKQKSLLMIFSTM